MTIGQALKSYRIHAGLSQAEMAAGIVSESFYSRVERDLNKIDADTLIKILTVHHFNIGNFFDHLAEASKRQSRSYFGVEGKIIFAVNNGDLPALQAIGRQIKNDPDCPQWISFRYQMAYAWLTHSNEKISPKLKAKVRSMVNKENWDYLSYYFLSQALIFLDLKDAINYTKMAFHAYQKKPDHDANTLEEVSILAVNFLMICVFLHADLATAQMALDFLKDLPVTPEIGLAKMMGVYYEAYFKGDHKTAAMVIALFKKSGQYSLIKDTVVKK